MPGSADVHYDLGKVHNYLGLHLNFEEENYASRL